jgi:seryl-tRNA synthetase
MRYLGKSGKLEYVHTVNGTAAAIPRLIIALLETHQTSQGDVRIPKVLQPYLMGLEIFKQGKTILEMMKSNVEI